jgi:hypothetical protein
MNNSVLVNEIEYWRLLLQSNSNYELIELAFFKIFIKYEKFISDIFIQYSIGMKSDLNYCPVRKLNFVNEVHLNKMLQKRNTSFINHFEVVLNLSEHVFVDNPFEILTSDANYSSEVKKMKIIRDYIAHESSHAKKKFENSVTNNVVIKPHEFLNSTNRRLSISYYSYYLKIMEETSEYITKGPL